jgi:hypothetical protein
VVRPDLGSGAVGCIRLKNSDTKFVKVPVRSLSSLIDEFAPRNASVSVICDIEGAEIAMLQNDKRAFERVNQIAIELHSPEFTGCPETPDDMLKAFADMGFKPHMTSRNRTHGLLKRDAG